jgi:alpha-galactosidase
MPDSLELWVKPLKNGELALCFFNRTEMAGKINLNWNDLILQDHLSGMNIHFDKQIYNYKDLWQNGTGSAKTNRKFEHQLAPHSVVVLKLTPAAPDK